EVLLAEAGERRHQLGTPTRNRVETELGDLQVGLKASVVQTEQDRRESGEPDRHHNALEIDTVTYVGRGPGHRVRAVQHGVEHLIEDLVLLQLATLVEV